MSNTNVETAVTKKITLAGKYTKFMVSGSWFVDRLAAAGTIDETATAAARVQLGVFDEPEKQNEMFDLFFANIKDSTKSMKTLIKEHNKPPPKAKKEKVVKEKAEKKPKGKKQTVSDPQDELVAEIVAAAQSEIPPGAEKRTVLRKGEPTVPLNPLPSSEDVAVAEGAVVTEVVEPVKKKVVKKGAPAVPPNPLPLTSVDVAEAKKAAKIAEDEAKKAAKALEAETKKAAKAAEVEAKKAAKALEAETKKAAKIAEDEAKKAAKALEAETKKATEDPETKKAAKAIEDETKKAAKVAEVEAKKAAKAAEVEAKKAAKAAEDEAKKAAKAAEVEAKKAAKPAKKEKETKATVQPEIIDSPEEDDDQDTLNLRPISFPDGRSFLLDESNNNLYDPSCVDMDDFAPVATYRGNQWFPLTPSLAGLGA